MTYGVSVASVVGLAVAVVATGAPAFVAPLEKLLDLGPSELRVTVGEFEHGGTRIRGAAAARDLAKDEVVLRIGPEHVFNRITPEVSGLFGASYGRRLAAAGGDVYPGWTVYCALAAERQLGRDSPWWPFLASLPGAEELRRSHPLYAREELLGRFAALPLVREIQRTRRGMDRGIRKWSEFVLDNDAPEWREKAPNERARQLRNVLSAVTADDLIWASTVLATRAFRSRDGPTLIPLVDLLNVDAPERRNVRWTPLPPPGGFEFRTTRPVAAGAELVTGYSGEEKEDEDSEAVHWGFIRTWSLRRSPAPLNGTSCERLSAEVRAATRGGGCAPPRNETQPGILCLLTRLARDHCPNATAFSPNTTAVQGNATALAPNASSPRRNGTAPSPNATALLARRFFRRARRA